jgi:hypothetical protein
MPNQIDEIKSPYGLNGGLFLSGSVSKSVDGFWYYPITASVARITLSNIDSGSAVSASFSGGVGLYGKITSVTQSEGIAIVYYGAPDQPRY